MSKDSNKPTPPVKPPPPAVKPEKRFTGVRKCGHCGNTAPMEIVKEASFIESEEVYHRGHSQICWEEGWCYEILKCPACLDANVWRSYYHSQIQDEPENEHLFPIAGEVPLGLPDQIASEYATALKVKSIDPNLHGVQLRRVLELAVHERGAKGKTLHKRLEDLASKGEIPERLANLATNLRHLGNIGAHANPSLKLTTTKTPILEKLCLAVLEYLYSAPHLIDQAENRLKTLSAPENNTE